jgi:hypothetical protein
MPLFAYFTRVGLGLLALLLVLNSMLEAEKSEAERAVPAVETRAAEAQSTRRVQAVEWRGPILSLQRSEATNYGLPVASYASLEQRQQLSTDEPEPSSVPKVKFKRKSEKARVPTRREKARVPTRRQEPSAYASYARDTSYLSAVDRHAPR